MIDAGYPADTAGVLDSLRQIGCRLADVEAVVITHALLDHIGAIPALIEQVGMPVYAGAEEVRHAKRWDGGPRRMTDAPAPFPSITSSGRPTAA